MLPRLPGDLATPVLVVQHMPPKFTLSLARDLATKCSLDVAEAADGDLVVPGRILIAPGGHQMKVEKAPDRETLIIRITDDPPENHCRPSVDYLFRSLAHLCADKVVGVIMTGMGSDGTLGCRLLKRGGASIIAQNEATCVVFGMPKQPVEEGLADAVLPLGEIAGQITRLAGRGVATCR
jgi:two-component system chemotaxis response regulator CheB